MINSKDIHVRNCLTDSDHIRQEKELATLEAMENFKGRNLGEICLFAVCRRKLGLNSELLRLWHWQSDALSLGYRSYPPTAYILWFLRPGLLIFISPWWNAMGKKLGKVCWGMVGAMRNFVSSPSSLEFTQEFRFGTFFRKFISFLPFVFCFSTYDIFDVFSCENYVTIFEKSNTFTRTFATSWIGN